MSAQPKPTGLTEGHAAIIRLLARQGAESHMKKEAQRDRRHLRPVQQ